LLQLLGHQEQQEVAEERLEVAVLEQFQPKGRMHDCKWSKWNLNGN
jgi:hypothetical protein